MRLPLIDERPPCAPPAGADLTGRRVALVHLGCPKNLVDSEHMLARLAASGATLTGDTSGADVLVLNTCAFIDQAKQESIDRILEAERWKAAREGRRLVVAGCLAERHPEELRREVPAIDALVGTGAVLDVARAAAGLEIADPGREPPRWLPDAATARILSTSTHTAWVKIAEGCDHPCSFCIIPKLRGAQRSRPVADIVREVEGLVELGVREVNLVAQDSTAYGEDQGLRDGLARLLLGLGRLEGLAWVRVHYAYPTRVSEPLLDAMAGTARVCKYLDIPLQHADRAVLRRMRRPGDRDSYLRLLERVRKHVPGVTVRTTFIVGFPNETERRFESLLEFVREAELDRVGVFRYSHEEGTEAGTFANRVPRREKERRRAALMGLQAAISRRRLRRLVGETREVLVDAVQPDRAVALGRLEGQAPEIDGVVRVTGCGIEPGEMARVRIVKASTHDLEAVVAS